MMGLLVFGLVVFLVDFGDGVVVGLVGADDGGGAGIACGSLRR